MKNVWVVCGINASRSQTIEQFLSERYVSSPQIKIRSAGLDVDIMREDDKRTLLTKEMAEEADIIFASDHDKFHRISDILNNQSIGKLHLLRIPDVFHTHRNAYLPGKDNLSYEEYMQKIESEPEFKELLKYVDELNPKESSALTEALYVKELYSAHLPPNKRQDKKFPFQLLYKTLEFRFPEISELISEAK